MKTEIKKAEGKYIIDLIFSKEEFEKEQDAVCKATAGRFKVQGFRPGKAPRTVIEKQYGADVFAEEAINKILTREFTRVLGENPHIKPVDRPEIEQKDKPMEDLHFILTVDVEPEFNVGKYTGLDVKCGEANVADVEIEDFLKEQVKMRARQVPAENGHKIAKGDVVVIDFVGSVDGVEFAGGKAEGHELEIGSKSFIDTFEDQLIGKTLGEHVDVNVTFPEKYHAENLAGKKALFVVDIKAILKREFAKIDDSFAKEASEFDNLADWKKDIREKLVESAKARVETEAKNELLKLIIEGTKVNIPEKMIDRKFAEIMEDMEKQLGQQGATVEMYAQHMNMSVDKIMETQRENAVRSVKARLVLDAIIAKEKVEVTDADVKVKVDEIVAKYGKDAAKQLKDPAQLEWIREDLRFEKLMTWLMKNNKIDLK